MGYLLGRGCVYIGERDATGLFKAVREFHTPEFELEVATEYAEHMNSCDAVKARDLRIVASQDAKARLVIDTHDPEILAYALGGEVTEQASGGTFTAKAFPSGIVAGDIVPVPGGYVNLESLTITDSAGSPATLTAGTHYTADLENGLVTFITVGSYTQPFKAAGSENDAFDIVSIATETSIERFIRFAGINIADGDKPVIVDIFRASVGSSKVAAKNEGNEVAKFEFELALLRDENAPFSEDFGRYGRYVKV